MKFDYLKQPNFRNPNQPWISRPLIPVRLLNGEKQIRLLALVDSGADSSLFHASIARELGLDLRSGREQTYHGISGGNGITAFVHSIEMQIQGAPEVVKLQAAFTESEGVGAILGQSDFFDFYHIRFEKDKDRIEIVPGRKKG